MNEEALKKKAHDYVMNHYDSEGYGTCLGRLEEAAYIAGYKVAMQRIYDTIAFMRDDIIEHNLQVEAITVLNDILNYLGFPDYLKLSHEEAKDCMEQMSDDSPIGIVSWVAKEE